ncbi:hypothetical protein BJY24_005652 [Nocardia transvalensis]|uniref:Integral membrane protein n=1 Tax=Nocardia transvalensis TaxID=37333 RepID=A0A7W9ULI5_9NOCA|nr:hypothetical protein [Nocardia transvalensis]MBB5916740.1 hypothetical protein [Nocardia transvalensis]
MVHETLPLDVRRTRAARAMLAGISGFTAFWAMAGAVGLLCGGADLGATVTARLPWHSPGLAGVLLALVIGAPMALTAAAVVRRDGRSDRAAVLSGALLIGWTAVQPAIIGQFSRLQPVFGLLGVAVVALGLYLHAHRSR